jgi:hypothetical protein
VTVSAITPYQNGSGFPNQRGMPISLGRKPSTAKAPMLPETSSMIRITGMPLKTSM